MFKMPQGPFCQSCGMPLNDENLFGTEKDGIPSTEYCTYCYKDGGFCAPDMKLEDMLKKATQMLVEKKGYAAYASVVVDQDVYS